MHSAPRPSLMVDVSICTVSLNCRQVFADCLKSLQAADPSLTWEVINVDNASTDDTCEWLARDYPGLRVIRNDRNVGFSRATNQAIAAGSGRLILWLNTDTVLRQDSLRKLVDFLDTHPRVGIVGPKLLNADGSFQPQCRRGLPTPLASLAYLLGLHRLFPRWRAATGYLLSHLPADAATRVDAVSGACLLARREVWDAIGPLDEGIFGFGEDIDWCVRASQAGWEVWYYPASEIIHLKGQGGAHAKPYHKVWGIHQAMWVFYRKHLRMRYPRPFGILVWAGIATSLTVSAAIVWVRRRVRVVTPAWSKSFLRSR
jgi:GT2 family glycosyltransferase